MTHAPRSVNGGLQFQHMLKFARVFNQLLMLSVTLVVIASSVQRAEGQLQAVYLDNYGDDKISAYVRKVFQDRQGKYWFGTNDDGIALFDGTSLQYFTTENGLAGNAVRGILQDQVGAIWIATDNGVSRYSNGKFENFTTSHGLNHNDTWSIALDHRQSIWIGTRDGACRWSNNRFTPVELPKVHVDQPISRIAPNLVWNLCVDRQGVVWIGTDGLGVFRFNGHEATSLTESDGLLSNQVSSIVEGLDGRLWFGFLTGGVCSYDGKEFKSYGTGSGLPKGWVWTMLSTQRSHLIVSVLGSGMYEFNGNSFQAMEANELGLPDHVQSLLEDSGGNLWLGCSGGLYRIESKRPIPIAKSGPWLRANELIDKRQPLLHFEKLVVDSWVVTAASGTTMEHTWKWGPSKQSIERWTQGQDAKGGPWSELAIYYWHPHDKKVHFFGISPFQAGISRGTIDFNGESATADSTLVQETLGKRQMQTRWTFKDANHYVETLLEKDASGNLVELVAFDHYRSQPERAKIVTPHKQTIDPPQFDGLKFLLGKPWNCTTEDGEPMNLSWSLTWIPVANFCYGEVQENSQSNTQDHSHFFIFRERDFKGLRFLALCANSDVIIGDVNVTPGGGVRLDGKRITGSTNEKIASSIEAISNVHLRQTIEVVDSANAVSAITMLHDR